MYSGVTWGAASGRRAFLSRQTARTSVGRPIRACRTLSGVREMDQLESWTVDPQETCTPSATSRGGRLLSETSVAYLIGSLVGAAVVLDGIWMMASARPLIRIPGGNLQRTPAVQRWTGVAEIIGGTGIGAGFGVIAGSGLIPAGAYIVFSGVVGNSLCYVAAWWVDYRARRPVSN
jgi:hypothetical protein